MGGDICEPTVVKRVPALPVNVTTLDIAVALAPSFARAVTMIVPLPPAALSDG